LHEEAFKSGKTERKVKRLGHCQINTRGALKKETIQTLDIVKRTDACTKDSFGKSRNSFRRVIILKE
jgi:hypothetical protein